MLTTWFTGRHIVRDCTQRGRTPLEPFLESILADPPPRAPGTAVYMFGTPDKAPPPLLYNFRSNGVLHRRVLAVSVITDRVPRRDPGRRVEQRDLGHGISQVTLHYGFMEEPHVATDLHELLGVDPVDTTYFLGSETVIEISTQVEL